MTHDYRRLATAANEMQATVERLQKKVHDQRQALRRLSRAHELLWRAIKVINGSPETLNKVTEERKALREDIRLFREMKATIKADSSNRVMKAFELKEEVHA